MKLPRSRAHSILFAVAACAVGVHEARALNPQVAQLVKWETGSNAVAKRSSAKIAIQHFEIPLAELRVDLWKDIDPRIRNALIFKKADGQEYVRWIINPEDTKWHVKVEEWMKSKNIPTTKHKYFDGYMTASRSFILEDPKSGYAFSGKVSTNATGGHWKDKDFPISDARQVRMATDHVKDVEKKVEFQRLKTLPEPAMFGIEGIDQAFGIRSLGDAAEGKKYLIPAFSVLHGETGRKLAALNGSNDPAKYWRENFNKPLAEALAEFSGTYGLTYDSGHGQNFLLELDENMKPTGKVVLRDFADSYAQRQHMESLGWIRFLSEWDADNIADHHMMMAVGILHGNEPPDWIDAKEYKLYAAEFFEAYDKKFSEVTGVPLATLKTTPIGGNPASMSYMHKNYNTKDMAWNAWRNNAPCLGGSWLDAAGKPCPPNIRKRLLTKPPAGLEGLIDQAPVPCVKNMANLVN